MIGDSNHHFQRVEGAVIGFAVADALGVPVEFSIREELRLDPVCGMRSGGTHRQPAGTWSDDTSMTLCMIHSLIEKGIDYEDQMSRFADWMVNGNYTATGEVFDIGGATQYAINNYRHGKPALECGDKDEETCGNGSLMRMMPLALYLQSRYNKLRFDDFCADIIHKASDCTHASRRCEMACGIYCSIIFSMCSGGDLSNAVMSGLCSSLSYYRDHPNYKDLCDRFDSMLGIADWREAEVKSGGYVIHTLQAAIWCLLTTGNYADCVLKAVNLGNDTDTTAAVAGALAGMWYGANTIPSDWVAALAKADEIKALCESFSNACLGAGS